MPDFRLPDLGEGLTEAEVIAWRVGVGDEVSVDQVVVEVETAKAAVEVPIPFAGRVSALHGAPGDSIAVGAALITVEAPVAVLREPGVAAAPAGVDGSGNVLIGYGTSAAAPRRRRLARGSTALQHPVSTPLAATADQRPVKAGVISPLVRKMARDGGVDLDVIAGSGPSGLILRRDVEAAQLAPEPARPVLPAAARVEQSEPAVASEQRIPLRGTRKAIADKLSRSRREIPEATVWVDVDATDLLAARAAMNAGRSEQPVSILALLARFAIAGLRRYPELNARIEADEIVLPAGVNLGFAAQTDRGLVVPVVRDAQALSTRDLSAAIAALTGSARAGTLQTRELTGGTFTLNNYGVFGVDGSAAIINHPEVAILGIGRIVDKPWVVAGALAVRKVTQLTLAFDHRACDGATAGGLLRYVADCVESPVSLLADL
jgi:pyruvate dehydrogenase E2 component (dihydrolipoamide acetyltransferase)